MLTDTIKLELVYNTEYTIWSGDWKKHGEESQHLSASGGLKEKKEPTLFIEKWACADMFIYNEQETSADQLIREKWKVLAEIIDLILLWQ